MVFLKDLRAKVAPGSVGAWERGAWECDAARSLSAQGHEQLAQFGFGILALLKGLRDLFKQQSARTAAQAQHPGFHRVEAHAKARRQLLISFIRPLPSECRLKCREALSLTGCEHLISQAILGTSNQCESPTTLVK